MSRARFVECPHCEARVPRGVLACPECGSDATTGWSDEADDWAGDLPTGYGDDDEFDYEDALAGMGLGGRPSRTRLQDARRKTWIVVVIVIAALALVFWR
jgi:hypothetical protein